MSIFWEKKILIILISLLTAIVFVICVHFLSPAKYSADILVYIDNNTISISTTTINLDDEALSAAKEMLDNYMVLLKSRSMLASVIKKANLSCTKDQLAEMISAGSVNETECFTVTVTADSADQAYLIANTIAEVFPEQFTNKIVGSELTILDYAIKPKGKVSPLYVTYAECGFV
ncbi:MAG: hypothetical protein KBS41_04950, partial [Oscillospiraceae bacterium]|nr:hypothetical protein [Candidatus Equicaccousia limihippi]